MKNSFSKVTILTSFYLLSVYIIGILITYVAKDIDLGSDFQPVLNAFIKYLFNLVLPLSVFILLYKYRENNFFFKNLKFVLNPIIRFEIIIYILSSAFVILACISAFLKMNPVFVQSFQVWVDANKSGDITSFKDAIPYIENNHSYLITELSEHFNSLGFLFSSFISLVVILFSITFFINTIQILLNQNLGFIKNIKKSLHIFKTKIIAITVVIIAFLFLFSLFNQDNMDYHLLFFIVLLYKNFIFTVFANSLILLSEDNLNEPARNDDIYDVEVKD
jgi:hypothetical protein